MTSFNKIIQLSKQGKLYEYYNQKKGLLEHFKYKQDFLRKTKNVYISIVPEELIKKIARSQPVSDSFIHLLMKYSNREQFG